MEYKLWGTMSRRFGSYANIQVHESDGGSRSFNEQSGEREMLFYHPSLSYPSIINDLTLLPDISSDKFIEIGLSFDQPYSLEEVEDLIPDGVTVTWYWVNTIAPEELASKGNNQEPSPINAERVYGFDRFSDGLTAINPTQKLTEEDFIRFISTAIEQNDYYIAEYQRINNAVEKNKNDGLIIGAVVTGTRENLLALQDQAFIRAAVLGATVDRF